MAIKRVFSKTNDQWQYTIDIYVGSRRVRESGFQTKDDARDAIAAIRSDYKRGQYQFPADRRRVPLKTVADRWIAHLKRSKRTPATINRALSAFTRLYAIVPASTPTVDITTEHLARLFESREQQGVKPQTIFNDIRPIMAALRYAARQVPELHRWRPPDKPDQVRGDGPRRSRVITPEEERAILAALRAPHRIRRVALQRLNAADALELALGTGMREREILSLRQSDVHFERSPGYPHGWILVRATKTGNRASQATHDRAVPMNSRVAQILKTRLTASPMLFPARSNSRGPGHQMWLAHSLATACKQAGVAYGRDVAGGLVFHDTRHTAATRMLQDGVDMKTVMDILGHRNPATALAYTHSTAASRFQAVTALEQKPNDQLESASRPDESVSVPTRPRQGKR